MAKRQDSGRQRASDVLLEVFEGFGADGEADRAFLNSEGAFLLGKDVTVRGQPGHVGRRFDRAERRREADERQPREKPPRRLQAAAQVEGQHRAEGLHLPAGGLVPGVRRESRVVHSFDRRVGAQILRQPQGVLRLSLHAQRERLHPAGQEKRGEGIEDRSGANSPLADRLEELSGTSRESRGHIRMAVQVLGGRMENEMEAELDGTLQDGRGEGPVNRRDEAAASGQIRDEGQIHDLDQRVGRGFDVEPARLPPDRLLELRARLGLHERRHHTHRLEHVAEETQRAAVKVLGRNDVVARVDMREKGRRDGSHSRREERRILRAFEGRELLLRRSDGRVAFAGVEGIGRAALRRPGERVRVRKGEGRRLKDRIDEGTPPGRIEALPGVNGKALGAKTSFLAHPRRGAVCSGRKDFKTSSLTWIFRSARSRCSSARRSLSASRARRVSKISGFCVSKAFESAPVRLTTRKSTNPPGTGTGGPAWPLAVWKTAAESSSAFPMSGIGPPGPKSGVVLTSVSYRGAMAARVVPEESSCATG